METGKEMGGEKREEVRKKETKSSKAIDNTYGVRVRGRHKHRRGRFQRMVPPTVSGCLWAGSHKVPTGAAARSAKA